MRVVLVRHPRPLVAAGICYGRLDCALHPDGLAEIDRIVGELDGFRPRVVWSSPALRCRAVAERLSSAPWFDERLLELDFGAWEGVAWDSVDRDALDRWAAFPLGFAAPGGESGAALVSRVTAFYRELMPSGEDAVIVSHGGPLKVLAALLSGREVDLLAPAPEIGSVTGFDL